MLIAARSPGKPPDGENRQSHPDMIVPCRMTALPQKGRLAWCVHRW